MKAEMQARRQREEEARRRDEETLRTATNDLTIEEMQNLVAVEEMDVPVRGPSARTRGSESGGRSERWDPAWNGRKNFKKFRPKGQRGEEAPRLPRVIVALEEVPRKGHGIGEEYWLNSRTTGSSKSKSQSQSQSVRQGTSRSQAAAAADEDDGTSFRRRTQPSRGLEEEDAPMDDIIPDEIAGRPRDPEIEAMANANSTPSQTMQTESQRKTSGKRAAAQPAAGAPATKKAKQSKATTRSETVNLDDDDDDALKFRRRRR